MVRVFAIELSFPFLKTIVVGEIVIEPAKVSIGECSQAGSCRKRYLRVRGSGVAQQGNLVPLLSLAVVAVSTAIDKESVVAHAEAFAQGAIPKISGAMLALGRIRSGDVGSAGQIIGIGGSAWVGFQALGKRGQRNVDTAIGSFRVVAQTATGIVHWRLLLDHIGRACRGRPGPAVIADFAGVIEVVERDKASCQLVKIGRDGLGEFRELRVPVTDLKIA